MSAVELHESAPPPPLPPPVDDDEDVDDEEVDDAVPELPDDEVDELLEPLPDDELPLPGSSLSLQPATTESATRAETEIPARRAVRFDMAAILIGPDSWRIVRTDDSEIELSFAAQLFPDLRA